MSEQHGIMIGQAQLAATEKALGALNALSERYGLSLSQGQMRSLAQARVDALKAAGRVELGGGAIARIVYAFCDSPLICREDYYITLLALQDLFYAFRNDTEDALTDEELIEAMRRIFHGRAQGSLEYMENLTVSELCRAIAPDDSDDEMEEWDGN